MKLAVGAGLTGWSGAGTARAGESHGERGATGPRTGSVAEAGGANRCEAEAVPSVVTADIQAGIEQHIGEQAAAGAGYFRVDYEGQELKMKLVRVHTEYLANLGPRRHFACVDLACEDGNVYDVDFFLEGDPGAMRVTETTVHKQNGQPYYLWEQTKDGTWVRAELESAADSLLGVIEGRDQFEFLYQATVPKLTEAVRLWLPIPQSDAHQTVEEREISTPGTYEVVWDTRHGNKVLFVQVGPEDSGKTIRMRFDVTRLEKRAYEGSAEDAKRYLGAELRVPALEAFDTISADVLAGKQGDLVRARALYDHVMDRMKYMKFGKGFGQGDAVYACDSKSGNCTDFHAYFIALARSAGIPARFAIGASIPSDRDEGGIDGYHCWAEFYAEGKWWPVDISEADKYSSLSTYYFGHHPANRVELSRGRDLEIAGGPTSGPINFLAYPVMESGGKTEVLRPVFSFRRTAGH